MAEDRGNPTAPADQSSSTPGNPHFIGRHTPAAHNVLPTLRQTAYPTPREIIAGFARFARESANSPNLAKSDREILLGKPESNPTETRPEQLEAALNALIGILDEDGQFILSTALEVAFLVGRHGAPLPEQQRDFQEGREKYQRKRNYARTRALQLAAEERKKYPQQFKFNTGMAAHIKPLLVAEMKKHIPDYAVEEDTVRRWLAEDSWHPWTKDAKPNI